MDHTVYARLVRANSNVPIPFMTVRLDVNGAFYTLTTNSTGYGEKALKLEAVGGKATTYQVTAMFELAKKIDFWKFLYKWLYIPVNTIFMLTILGRLKQLGAI